MRVLQHFAEVGQANRHNLTNRPSWTSHGQGRELDEMMEALAEAYDWLDRHGLVAREPASSDSEWAFVTRLGRLGLEDRRGLASLRAGRRLEVDLHPSIEQTARRQFLIGEYELAVIAALRQVEIRVRELRGVRVGHRGEAHDRRLQAGGPPNDPTMDKGEAEAVMALFRGEVGAFKNPVSQRLVEYDDRSGGERGQNPNLRYLSDALVAKSGLDLGVQIVTN